MHKVILNKIKQKHNKSNKMCITHTISVINWFKMFSCSRCSFFIVINIELNNNMSIITVQVCVIMLIMNWCFL